VPPPHPPAGARGDATGSTPTSSRPGHRHWPGSGRGRHRAGSTRWRSGPPPAGRGRGQRACADPSTRAGRTSDQTRRPAGNRPGAGRRPPPRSAHGPGRPSRSGAPRSARRLQPAPPRASRPALLRRGSAGLRSCTGRRPPACRRGVAGSPAEEPWPHPRHLGSPLADRLDPTGGRAPGPRGLMTAKATSTSGTGASPRERARRRHHPERPPLLLGVAGGSPRSRRRHPQPGLGALAQPPGSTRPGSPGCPRAPATPTAPGDRPPGAPPLRRAGPGGDALAELRRLARLLLQRPLAGSVRSEGGGCGRARPGCPNQKSRHHINHRHTASVVRSASAAGTSGTMDGAHVLAAARR